MKKNNNGNHVLARPISRERLEAARGGALSLGASSKKNCQVIGDNGDEFCDHLYVVLGAKTYLRIDTTQNHL